MIDTITTVASGIAVLVVFVSTVTCLLICSNGMAYEDSDHGAQP